MDRKTMEFKHCTIEGSPYQAGRQLGEMFLQDSDFISFMTTPFMSASKLSAVQLTRVMELFDRYSPGINDEMKGFAESVKADLDDVVYYFVYLQNKSHNCSHISLTPSITDNEHLYLGRNYDYDWNDNPVLIETHIEGQYKQIGFGCQLFGRIDGMNEHGLCVTTSAGVIQPNFIEEGFVFPFIVRSILNQCKTVDEAIELVNAMKIADYRNIIIADSLGNSALIEIAASNKAIKLAGANQTNKFLFSTNHYNLPTMKALAYPVVKHSRIRYEAIKASIKASAPKIGKEELRKILSTTMPDGVCCHHYADGMGTLWSMIFDAMDKTVDICFGSPKENPWRSFSLSHPAGLHTYSSILPNEPVGNDFWKAE